MVKNFEHYFNKNKEDITNENDGKHLMSMIKESEGRPKGSKNKPKVPKPEDTPVDDKEIFFDVEGDTVGETPLDSSDWFPKKHNKLETKKERKVRKAQEPEESFDDGDINAGDKVEVISWDDLSKKQEGYLRSKPNFTVLAITNQKGDIYDGDGEVFIDVGYRIPLKARRFSKIGNPKKVIPVAPLVKKKLKSPKVVSKPIDGTVLKGNEYVDPITGEVKTIDFKKLQIINEFPCILSDRLKIFLRQFKNYAAQSLLAADKTGEVLPYTFIDLVETKNDSKPSFSYLPAGKISYIALKSGIDLTNMEQLRDSTNPLWTASSRVPNKTVGSFIADLYGDFYDKPDYEAFTNEWRVQMNYEEAFKRFKIITGNDIKKYYKTKNYSRNVGTLKQSCMNDLELNGKSVHMLDMYCENPDKVGLLVLFDEEGVKIKSRAILWKGLRKPKDRWFLDRIYYEDIEQVELIKAYCRKNNWLYKDKQSRSEINRYMDGNSRIIGGGLAILLNPKKYKIYPYMDTMKLYTPESGRLGSTPGNNVGLNVYYIANPNGSGTKYEFKRGLKGYDNELPQLP